MTSTSTVGEYSCQECNYTTKRMYNLQRHIALVHNLTNFQSLNHPSRTHEYPSRTHEYPIQTHDYPTGTHDYPTGGHDYPSQDHGSVSKRVDRPQCSTCNRYFSCKKTLSKHVCKNKLYHIQCSSCNQYFSSKESLCNHKKCCKSHALTLEGGVTNNINQNTINHSFNNNNITNNNITNNLLVFPSNDQDFDFATDHIQDASMREFITHKKPALGFKRFMGKVFENPTNRIVQKTNVKDRFNKIHIGNGEWELDTDANVMPTMAHHMTTAALQKMDDLKKRKVLDDIRGKAKEFIKYIDEVNTNDECDDYKDLLDNIKVILVNALKLQ